MIFTVNKLEFQRYFIKMYSTVVTCKRHYRAAVDNLGSFWLFFWVAVCFLEEVLFIKPWLMN